MLSVFPANLNGIFRDSSGPIEKRVLGKTGEKLSILGLGGVVVMNTTANALLSMGASPVMAHAVNEVEEMVSFAGALVLNIGTLSDSWVTAMIR